MLDRGRQVAAASETVMAYANAGRWVVDCPRCNSGMAALVEWPAYCFDCGSIFAAIVFPKGWEKIEAKLLRRPERSQNWRPGESVEQLEAENAEHGLAVI